VTPGGPVALGDLFGGAPLGTQVERLAEGAVLLRGFAQADVAALMVALGDIVKVSPFRHMVTPGGYRMSVAMTNCGQAGWITDRGGYRYSRQDPATGEPWPAMPARFRSLAARAAAAGGFPGFAPDACLINRYEPESKLSLHRDQDERDMSAPVVSVSLGLPAIFLWGGLGRKDRLSRVRLESGDVVVWGGPARLAYHGIAPLADGAHPLTDRSRINLTVRRAL
jgi:DNA oxidative demethylase